MTEAMSQEFRGYLKKIGSGVHTSKNLSRQESAAATRLMLQQQATPAQIGAYLIAHRIKRATVDEMAGILDAFELLGPQVPEIDNPQPVAVFSVPYDGRSRTAPLLPLIALLLATEGNPVLMHGGTCMPTKYGVPLVDLWKGLGIDWTALTLEQAHQVLSETGLSMVYLPQHFSLAHQLVDYRDQIGKRPTLATAELLWCPYAGNRHQFSGFVHPPTERLLQDVFALRGNVYPYTTIKGLEGSCDLPCDRTNIIGVYNPDNDPPFERLFLSARDHDLGGAEVPLESTETLLAQMHQVIAGQKSPLLPAVLWSGGFYLWHLKLCPDLRSGIEKVRSLLQEGKVASTLQHLCQKISACS
ncbi:Anthranilate phosphoribosyltransferase [Acaryochloris thomasi RCC1774]|uniref:Anthranilate phosphoribosyltransferase n=1 Tax=Acaryochloris thomasi RCC1774 TaxID=1764569 RepID=A0A2W1JNH2_9CYAN|nr:anthranilate phosphoribosyltransferase family protein [Acaryochloris thomasi]PZD72995.1 Anthranilate phosphoribosyltransferase [Acaryochloris thomasi RCC1774]